MYNLANKKLEILQTNNAQTPITEDKMPVLVVDVREHTYYIDYKNAHPAYLEKFFIYINWAFISSAFEWTKKEGIGSVKFYISDIHKK